MLERLNLILDDNIIEKIKSTTVLILGVGGVGGYALESLARSGIGKLIIVDNDTIDKTNLNRQIISLNSNIGEYKVDAFEKRLKDINQDINIIKINEFITKDNMDILFKEKIDYIVDACDTINTKLEIIKYALLNNIKIISSMGMGNKFDPSKIEIIDIKKTSYDPIAKRVRKMLKDEKINKKLMVVASTETPIKPKEKIGSNAFVPAIAGLFITSYIINDIRSTYDKNNKFN